MCGGVYDKSPELHEGIFEQEYRKLAPYLNIFTGIQTLEARIKEDAELKAELGPEILERLRKRGLQFRRGKNIEKQIPYSLMKPTRNRRTRAKRARRKKV